MCGKSKRQRQAEATARTAALATLNGQVYDSSRTISSAPPQTNGIIPSMPQENPPPYTYPEQQPILEKKEKPVEPTYDTVAQEWLSTAHQQGRKPSFNSYHSFDIRAAPEQMQNADAPVGPPMQGICFA